MRKAVAFVVVACSLVVAVSVHARAAPRYLPYTVTSNRDKFIVVAVDEFGRC